MASPATHMSEPNVAPVVPTLSLDIPHDSDNGSTAQPTPTNAPMPLPPTMPQVSITFLIISGQRRTMSFDPSSSLGRVKELVWLSWPSEWSDDRPPAPNYLRILYLGRLLQDDDVLESLHNPLAPSAAATPVSPSTSPSSHSMIMHLSIRPSPPLGEADDFKKKRKRIGRSASSASGTPGDPDQNGERSGCCGCVIC